MTTGIRAEQAAALGGAAPCQPAKAPPLPGTTSSSEPPITKSVVIVDPEKEGWIGIELKDTKGRPVPNAAFIVAPSGHDPVHGNLDSLGRARVEGVDPGTCVVEFPSLHRKEFAKGSG